MMMAFTSRISQRHWRCLCPYNHQFGYGRRAFSLWPFSSDSTVNVKIPEPPPGDVPWQPDIANAIIDQVEYSPGFFSNIYSGALDLLQQGVFEPLHDMVGLPWWLTVISGTVAMRIFMFPTKISSLRNSRRMNAATQEFSVRVAPLLQRRYGKDEKAYKLKAQEELAQVFRQKGVSLGRSILPLLINVPLFVWFSATLRRMSEAKVFGPEYFLWLTNSPGCLSWPDPYLTCAMVVINAIALEVGRRTMPGQPSAKFLKFIGIIGHSVNMLSFWFLSVVPSSIPLFIGASNVMTLVENLLLRTKMMQRFIK